jgi:predicted dehydrogenase
MRICLLGAGRIGRLHGTLFASQPEVDEIVVSDVDPGRAAETAAAIGGRVAPTPDEAMEGADAVIVAASTDAHAGLVAAAIERGLPTFCEKPLALDLPQTVELVERIEARGAVVQVGFQRRFDPAHVEARRLDAPALPGPAWQTFLTRFETAYREELKTFLRVVRGEIASPCTARDGLQAMRIAVAAGRSRSEHRPVRPMDV